MSDIGEVFVVLGIGEGEAEFDGGVVVGEGEAADLQQGGVGGDGEELRGEGVGGDGAQAFAGADDGDAEGFLVEVVDGGGAVAEALFGEAGSVRRGG